VTDDLLRGDSSKAAVFLAAIMATPFFLKVTGASVELGDPIVAAGSGQTLPISVFAVVLFLGMLAPRMILAASIKWRRSPLNAPILFLALLNLVILLAGLFYEPRIENFLFFLETIAPLACFFVALNSVRSVETVREILVGCVWVVGIFVLSLAVSVLVASGSGSSIAEGIAAYLLVFPVYQLFDYVPLVIAVVYGLGLALLLGGVRTRGTPVIFCFVLGMLLSLFLLHSKGALATAVLVTVIQMVLFGRNRGSAKQIGVFSVAFGLLIAWVLLGPETPTLESARDLLESRGEDTSYQTRVRQLSFGLEVLLQNPIAGQMYMAQDMGGGLREITNPHNQYVTYAVRGGVISLLVYLWILVVFLQRLWRLARNAPTPLMRTLGKGLFSVFLGVALISNMLQDNFTQPYSGFLLFFLMGVGEFLIVQSGSPHRRATSAAPTRLPAACVES
jgi:O-antigen ligase